MTSLKQLGKHYSRRVKSLLSGTLDSERLYERGLTYLNQEKLSGLNASLQRINRNKIGGDMIEFGVALGGTAVIIAKAAQGGRTFHGFDVFGMIPPPNAAVDGDDACSRYEVIRAGNSKGITGQDDYYGYRHDLLNEVKNTMAAFGIPVDGVRVQLHKGLFEDTWPHVHVDKIAFAHIDCDWYDPVLYCLNAVAPLMSRGGEILLDDYYDYSGARDAVNYFRDAHQNFEFIDGRNPILRCQEPG